MENMSWEELKGQPTIIAPRLGETMSVRLRQELDIHTVGDLLEAIADREEELLNVPRFGSGLAQSVFLWAHETCGEVGEVEGESSPLNGGAVERAVFAAVIPAEDRDLEDRVSALESGLFRLRWFVGFCVLGLAVLLGIQLL